MTDCEEYSIRMLLVKFNVFSFHPIFNSSYVTLRLSTLLRVSDTSLPSSHSLFEKGLNISNIIQCF